MKIANEARNFEGFGIEEEGEFTIARSGKAFRALIDGLYADKTQSIVRELSANAFDSHKRAAQSEPFFIHVPSYERKEFFVRDYGIGMDHKTVMHLYSTMFMSDKTETDDEVGMFGLGSKTPFAYTDQFYVICYDGKTARHYAAAIGSDGIPRILKVLDEENEEPRGVRVGFAVEDDDFGGFSDAVKLVALAHDPAFDANIDLPKNPFAENKAFEGPGWSVIKYNRGYGYGRASLTSTWNVRQGCVIYPLEAVGGLTLPADNKYQYLIDAPIGKVSVTTSRERVEYKKATVEFLQAKIAEIQKSVVEQIWTQIEDIESVVKFFQTAKELVPGWAPAQNYTHPPTGLNAPTIKFAGLSGIFKATLQRGYSTQSDHWEYRLNTSLSLELSYDLANTYHVLKDLTPFLDPQDDDTALIPSVRTISKTEHRRLARYVRAYATANGLESVTLLIGVDWTEKFWNAALPGRPHHNITFDEMKGTIPKREKNPDAPTLIRGIGLALKGGDNKPVFEIDPDVSKAVWIGAEEYKNNKKPLFTLLTKFGFEKIYVVSSGAETKIQAANIPLAADALKAVFKTAKIDVSLWLEVSRQGGSSGSILEIGKNLLKTKREDLYEKLTKVKGAMGSALKNTKAVYLADLPELEYDEKRVLTGVIFYDNIKGKLIADSAVTKKFKASIEKFQDSYSHPTVCLINNVSSRGFKDPDKMVKIILACCKISPIDVAF